MTDNRFQTAQRLASKASNLASRATGPAKQTAQRLASKASNLAAQKNPAQLSYTIHQLTEIVEQIQGLL